jgi:hypothetical protein
VKGLHHSLDQLTQRLPCGKPRWPIHPPQSGMLRAPPHLRRLAPVHPSPALALYHARPGLPAFAPRATAATAAHNHRSIHWRASHHAKPQRVFNGTRTPSSTALCAKFFAQRQIIASGMAFFISSPLQPRIERQQRGDKRRAPITAHQSFRRP